MILRYRAQSSQLKVLHSAGLAAIGRDSFAHGLETASGAITYSLGMTPPSPPRNESNNAKIEAKSCSRVIVHMRNNLNRM